MRTIIILISLSLFFFSSLAWASYKGISSKGEVTDPHIVMLEWGPTLPEKEFRALGLRDDFFAAYYRIIISHWEIYTYIRIDLVGLFDEGFPKVVNSFELLLTRSLADTSLPVPLKLIGTAITA